MRWLFPAGGLLLAGLVAAAYGLGILWNPGRGEPEPPPRAAAGWHSTPCWANAGWSVRQTCAWFLPPERGADNDAALPVVVLQHSALTRSDRATLVVMGGPGSASYLDPDALPYWREWQDSLGLDHDMVLYDQRGTGLSYPRLHCPDLDALELGQLSRRMDADAAWAEYEPLLLDCVQRVPEADRAAGLFGTPTAARDLRALAAALQRTLGYREVNLYGVSYGARLVAHAASEPDPGVGRAVLDSHYPPGMDLYLDYPGTFARILDAFIAQCMDDGDCQRDPDQLRALFDRALQHAERQDLRVSLPSADWGLEGVADPFEVVLDASTLFSLVEHMLFADAGPQQIEARLERFLDDDLDDDWHALVEDWVLNLYDPDFSTTQHMLVQCRDNPAIRAEDELAALQAFPAWRPALQRADAAFSFCARAGVTPDPLQRRPLQVPTLLVAAEFDPRTPADIAVAAVRADPAVEILQRPVAGHGVVDFDACAAQAVGAFLNSGARAATQDCVLASE